MDVSDIEYSEDNPWVGRDPEDLSDAIDTCLAGIEEFIIDSAKRLDAGDQGYVRFGDIALALMAYQAYEVEEEDEDE